jgi:hypothetical protein
MAQIKFIAPVDTIKGKLQNRDKTIFRRKRIFDAEGHVIGELAQEAYVVHNPRDWKKNPPKGAEKQRIDNWSSACKQASEIRKNPDLLAQWKRRWEAQLKQGEADAPIDPTTRKPKIYIRFDCFVRAAIFRSLKQ